MTRRGTVTTRARTGPRVPSSLRFSIGLLTLAASLAACDDGDPLGPPGNGDEIEEITVNASSAWAPVRLAPSLAPVGVEMLSTSQVWDLAFLATSVLSNGGEGGPGGVEVHCLCQNSDASDAQIIALEPQDADDLFGAVGTAQIPTSESDWLAEELTPVIEGWYAYDLVSHTVSADPDAVWKLRLSDDAGFAKFRVVEVSGGDQTGPERIRLEYAVQTGSSESMGPTEELWVDSDAESGVRIDIAGGAAPSAVRWDLELEGWVLRVNGGVSGDGGAGAYRVAEAFEAIDDASDLVSQLYAADSMAGGFSMGDVDRRWYRYNLEDNHQIWPTYNVYLVRRNETVWKVQILGYYGADGSTRQITLRSAPLAPEDQ